MTALISGRTRYVWRCRATSVLGRAPGVASSTAPSLSRTRTKAFSSNRSSQVPAAVTQASAASPVRADRFPPLATASPARTAARPRQANSSRGSVSPDLTPALALMDSAGVWSGTPSASSLLGGALPRRRQQFSDLLDRGRHQPVVGPHTALLPLQQTGLGENTKVVADSRLRQTDRSGQVADARLAIGRGLDEAEQPQARWVGESLQHAGQTVSVSFVVDLAGERRRLGQDQFGQRSSHVLHPSTTDHRFDQISVTIEPTFLVD